MKHLGDITKISGHNAPPVDVIIGGSPCQDLSVAGKRAGLAGERSGLYMEQIRIIKEMREADVLRGRTDELIRPRYMVWENVPGAFSGNGGKDFAAVLEEAIRVAEPKAPPVSVPDKGWPTSGCFFDVDGRWSVAWRVFDAQFWGVPQRRRRIALVADFGGLSAPEILFVRKGVSGNLEPGKQKGKGAPHHAEDCTGATDREGEGGLLIPSDPGYPDGLLGGRGLDAVGIIDNIGGQAERGWEGEVAPTLKATHYKCAPCVTVPAAGFCTEHSANARGIGYQEECALTLRAGVTPALVYSVENHPGDSRVDIDESGKVQTLTSRMGTGGGNGPMVMEPRPVICLQGNGIDRADTAGCNGAGWWEDVSYTLNTIDRPAVDYVTDVGFFNTQENISPTLLARQYKVPHLVTYPQDIQYIVRRLTPLECERLQGFPDGWTDIGEWIDSKGKKHKEADSPRYKALGNSIALPNWAWILKRISAVYERDATMASLFDGIGGFPLIWERINGKGSCIWASEIEEFPMAVTKVRFCMEVPHE